MTIDEAIKMVEQKYEEAADSHYVHNPIAYALYQVWKVADRAVIAEPVETDLTDKCGSCEWAMPIKGSKKGVFGCHIECQHPEKYWRSDISKRKARTSPKCKYWEKKKGCEGDEGKAQS